MACTFWTSQRPKVIKVLRTWCALQILMSKRGFNAFPGTTACNVWTCQSQLPKVLQRRCALPILTSKCASRHNSRHFFEYFKFQKCSATDTKFNVIYFQTRFAPQRRALFRHPATVFRTWGTFHFLISKSASRDTFLGDKTLEKTQCFGTFRLFQALAPSCFWLDFPSSFQYPFLLTLPTSPVSVFHIVGRLPSQTTINSSRSWLGQHHSISIIIVGYCGQT